MAHHAERPVKLLKALLVLPVLLAACAPAYRGEPLYGPLDTSAPEVAFGQQVFDINCSQCHPGGSSGLGPALNNKPLPPGLIKFQVRHGLGAMPAFSQERLSDEELDALVTYLLKLRAKDDEGSS